MAIAQSPVIGDAGTYTMPDFSQLAGWKTALQMVAGAKVGAGVQAMASTGTLDFRHSHGPWSERIARSRPASPRSRRDERATNLALSKDRAAPFSKKHRRYWIPVTGGMVVIGIINILIGLHSYKPPENPERIILHLRDAGFGDAAGTIGNALLPADVIRAFAVKYPQVLPAGAHVVDKTFVISFPPGGPHTHATFTADGTFVSED